MTIKSVSLASLTDNTLLERLRESCQVGEPSSTKGRMTWDKKHKAAVLFGAEAGSVGGGRVGSPCDA
jgi:hypothetical protein